MPTRRPRDNVSYERQIQQKVEDLSELVPMAKAHFVGLDVQPSNVKTTDTKDQDSAIFSKSGSLEPPYSPQTLCRLFEHSNSLRQNIDAYAVNIDGNGHRFDPVIDLDSDDAFDQVRDAMYFEALMEAGDPDPAAGTVPEIPLPSDEEVEARIEKMEIEMRLEKAKVESFFRFCCVGESFVSLRKKTRQDKEMIGNGFWEVLRNGAGNPAQFNLIPGFTVRLMPFGKEDVPIEIELKVKKTPLTISTIKVQRRFRRYVQVFEGSKTYFKEYGDPRVVSVKTGKTYKDANELQAKEPGVGAATEVLHFAIYSPRTPYGIPRWIGTLLAVLGSRQSEEVNFLYFENKSVPPMAVLVSGGRLTSDSTKKIETFIDNRIKGRQNFHKVLVIEAEPAGKTALTDASGKMKIEIVPLTQAQQQDALFQNYDERNIDKVGMSFRLPRLLRGDIRDFNRATADAALEFAETQVFAPEREDFDWTMNQRILADLGIRFWMFASNSPTARDPMDLAEIVTGMVNASILIPSEARELAKGIFNRDFKKIDEIWTKIPPELLKAGIVPEGEDVSPGMDQGGDGGDGTDTGDQTDQGDEGNGDETQPGAPQTTEDGQVAAPAGGGEQPQKAPLGGQTGAAKKTSRRGSDSRRGKTPGYTSLGYRYKKAAEKDRLRKLVGDLLDLRNLLAQAEKQSIQQRDAANRGKPVEVEKELISMSPASLREVFGVVPDDQPRIRKRRR